MRVVWKHELPREANVLMLHKDAEILHVAAQHDGIHLWEAHDEAEAKKVRRRFHVVGTGRTFPDSGTHVGSLLMRDGAFVFHVFEEPA